MSFLAQCSHVTGVKKNVVVFDGGGVRGRFALDLFAKIAREQNVPLTALISMCVGVSAGAMIAAVIAFGFLDDKHTVAAQCEAFYALLPKMFQKRNGKPLLEPKYDGTGKRATLMQLFGDKKMGDARVPLVVLCCSENGEAVEFRSWDPECKDLEVATVLDASSAAPGYFPPVEVRPGAWMIDGGIRANKPLGTALLAMMSLFQANACTLHVLSVGTFFAPTKPPLTKEQAKKMGIAQWMHRKIIDAVLGMQDRTSEHIMEGLFGKRFLRLECQVDDISLDDVRAERLLLLRNAATMVWQQRAAEILRFLAPGQQLQPHLQPPQHQPAAPTSQQQQLPFDEEEEDAQLEDFLTQQLHTTEPTVVFRLPAPDALTQTVSPS